MDRNQRRQVIQETLAACEQGGYVGPTGDWTVLDPASTQQRVRESVVHERQDLPATAAALYRSPSLLQVEDGDCLQWAQQLQSRGLSVCCLNMASPRKPGGGYLNGAGAQEENICRRSNYSQFLEPSPDRPAAISYPWREFMGIHSGGVQVFRGAEEDGYPWLPAPYEMSFVAVAAYSKPPLIHVDGVPRLTPEYAEKTRLKIQLALAIPLAHGHNAVVLSALGCGAFGNPPAHLAELFAEEIERGGYRHAYRHILFAILDDENAKRPGNPEGNFAPFRRIIAPETGQ